MIHQVCESVLKEPGLPKKYLHRRAKGLRLLGEMYLSAAIASKVSSQRIGYEIPQHLAENLTKTPKEGHGDSDEGLYVGGHNSA